MQTAFNSLLILILIATTYLAVVFFTETRDYGDTIVYEAVYEEIYIQPEIQEETIEIVASTTTPETVSDQNTINIEPSVIKEEENVTPPQPTEEQIVVIKEVFDNTQITVPEVPKTKESVLSFSDINEQARSALVNIFCITEGSHQYITPISGSGTIINENGVILTNAHIAQFWLFENFPTEGFVDCQIRTGSPAKPTYRAKLLYISPAWINENSKAIAEERPIGTGENDYALLLITESMTSSPLPESFPYIDFDSQEQSVANGDSILVGGYPAGLLGGRTIQQDLYASTAITEVSELYTFENPQNLDLISLGGSVVAQQGSSGGPAVNRHGRVVGLISTSSDGDSTDERDLRAITIEHIERSLSENNKTTLRELLSGDLNQKATAFTETAAPPLLQILLSSF